MKQLITVLLAVAIATLIPSTLTASSSAETLLRLVTKAGKVRSIQTRFTQEKRLSIFKQNLVSTGTFTFQRPRSMRWEYLEPVRSGFLLHGDAGKRWNELMGEALDFSVRRDQVMQLVSNQILLWTTLDLEGLSRTYEIEVVSDTPAILNFTPLEAGDDPLYGLKITFSPDDASIAMIEIQEGQDDTTIIRFHDTHINAAINPEMFTRP